MKSFSLGFISATMIFCFWIVVYFFYSQPVKPLEEVTVTQVSGEKITHAGFNYTASTIKFSTKAEGKGEIITEIPKANIPEARSWMQNNNAVMVELLLLEDRNYGVSYLRRWDNISAGGGVVFSEKKVEGIKVQAQYWFSL